MKLLLLLFIISFNALGQINSISDEIKELEVRLTIIEDTEERFQKNEIPYDFIEQKHEIKNEIEDLQKKRSKENNSRPTVGLVLAGGGAKGLAHIGVLRVLEDNNIPIDYIVGNSMGAVVGSLYSIGYSPDELEDLVQELHDDSLFTKQGLIESNFPKYHKTSMKDEELKKSFTVLNLGYDFSPDSKGDKDKTYGDRLKEFLGLDILQTSLPLTGISPGNDIYLFLKEKMAAFEEEKDFRKLPIPFMAITTDLSTYKAKKLTEGDLALAVYQSMAIPGIFQPAPSWDGENIPHFTTDGLVVNNFPVDIFTNKEFYVNMEPEIIIGVDVGEDLSPVNFDTNIFLLYYQLATIKSLEANSINTPEVDILIEPQVKQFSAVDFSKSSEIIEAGEKIAHHILDYKSNKTKDLEIYKKEDSRFLNFSIISFNPSLSDSDNGKIAKEMEGKLLSVLKKKGFDMLSQMEGITLHKDKIKEILEEMFPKDKDTEKNKIKEDKDKTRAFYSRKHKSIYVIPEATYFIEEKEDIDVYFAKKEPILGRIFSEYYSKGFTEEFKPFIGQNSTTEKQDLWINDMNSFIKDHVDFLAKDLKPIDIKSSNDKEFNLWLDKINSFIKSDIFYSKYLTDQFEPIDKENVTQKEINKINYLIKDLDFFSKSVKNKLSPFEKGKSSKDKQFWILNTNSFVNDIKPQQGILSRQDIFNLKSTDDEENLTPKELKEWIDNINSLGYVKRSYYDVTKEGSNKSKEEKNHHKLTLNIIEDNDLKFRIGGNYNTETNSSLQLSFYKYGLFDVKHLKNFETIVQAEISEFYSIGGKGFAPFSDIFPNSKSRYIADFQYWGYDPLYIYKNDNKSTTLKTRSSYLYYGFEYLLKPKATGSLLVGIKNVKNSFKEGNDNFSEDIGSYTYFNLKLALLHDNRDDFYFPKEGWSFRGETSLSERTGGGDVSYLGVSGRLSGSVSKDIFTLTLSSSSGKIFGDDVPENELFKLGGIRENYNKGYYSFYGMNTMRRYSDEFLIGALEMSLRLSERLYLVTRYNALTYSDEFVNNYSEKEFFSDYEHGFGGGFKYDSFLGPLEFIISNDVDSSSLLWNLFLGYEF